MQIKEIINKDEWNNFVSGHHPNTFLHSWEWGQIQKETGEGVQYLGVYENKQQVAAALVITVIARRGTFFLIPHGPIFAKTSREQKKQILHALTQHAKEHANSHRAVALRIAPLLIASPETEKLFDSLGFRSSPLHIHAELTWELDITPGEEELLTNMRKTTRHAIRKAEKEGVTVDISIQPHYLSRFWPLYEQTKNRHGFVPFKRPFLEAQSREFIENNLGYFAIARHKNKDVAGAMLMHYSDTVFYYHGASIKLPSSIPAAQLLQWEAIKEAKRRGATKYNFWGIAPDNQPNHPFAGITTFKKGFGGRAIDYMHAQDYPLSLGYWKLWLIDSGRKKKRGF